MQIVVQPSDLCRDCIRLIQPGDDAQQRGFAAAGGAEQREEPSLADAERDVGQGLDRSAPADEPAHFDRRRGGSSKLCGFRFRLHSGIF